MSVREPMSEPSKEAVKILRELAASLEPQEEALRNACLNEQPHDHARLRRLQRWLSGIDTVIAHVATMDSALHRKHLETLERAEQGGLEAMRKRAFALCRKRSWSLERNDRLALHVMELAELAEALRGKEGDPIEEAGDLLFTALAMIPETISMDDVVRVNREKTARLMDAPPGFNKEEIAPLQPSPEPRGACPPGRHVHEVFRSGVKEGEIPCDRPREAPKAEEPKDDWCGCRFKREFCGSSEHECAPALRPQPEPEEKR